MKRVIYNLDKDFANFGIIKKDKDEIKIIDNNKIIKENLKFKSGYGMISYYNTIILNNINNPSSIFSLLTVYSVIIRNIINKLEYEKNIMLTNININNDELKNINNFSKLISYTDLDIKINMLFKLNNVYDYSVLFLNLEKYCIIFLINNIFFTITYINSIYNINDCYNNQQYNFVDMQDLINYLQDYYNFEDIDNIEYIIIDNKFKLSNKIVIN